MRAQIFPPLNPGIVFLQKKFTNIWSFVSSSFFRNIDYPKNCLHAILQVNTVCCDIFFENS